jgi:hypothetical protein
MKKLGVAPVLGRTVVGAVLLACASGTIVAQIAKLVI